MNDLGRLSIEVSVEGGEVNKIVSIAFFALFVYEWMITLGDEIEYFWSGPWSLSRILFFINRYFPFLILTYGLVVLLHPNPTPEVCRPSIQFLFIINIIALGVIQAMLILRVWYLFSNAWIQYGVVFCFVASNILSLSYTALSARNIELLLGTDFDVGPGCKAARPDEFFRMFMPQLGLHVLLYLLTVVRALQNRNVLRDAPVLKRLLRDGGVFFFVVFATISFTAVGSFLTRIPSINITVVFSNYLLSLTSIAMSRVMFSIHSLASNLGSSTDWLLSNVELSRVAWRQGKNKNEIIIERNYDHYDEEYGLGRGGYRNYQYDRNTVPALDIDVSLGRDIELMETDRTTRDVEHRSESTSPMKHFRLTESRIGVYDDHDW
ncbi:hypothetical protein K435DRAFT_838637 [Dendrothele bispora CBS 962.96]|uniref:DUF6533 domain-containing protein n=1 Tax=Dendrothele bispora (strain CBS 962.96) TaxID=1314807 RepID=A0A4S8M5A9_DENBC|nr:hypothetical protein K435DRAFT_838637 [Dendrothele bispora CBS 962.96]